MDSRHRASPPTRVQPNVSALIGALRRQIQGEVRFDPASRALYATDASNYRQVPIGVVIPKHIEDVIATVKLCREFGAPLLPRGAGTSLAGQTCNVAVVVDFSKYINRVLDLDPVAKTAWIEPGLVLDDLRNAAEQHGLTYGPDPATHNRCTLGGMIGNNACGVHSILAGMTDENVLELDILTYDGTRIRVGKTNDEELERIIRDGGRRGEIYRKLRALRDKNADLIRQRFPKIPRRVSGYNFPALLPEEGFDVARALVGSEGTCVTVLGAKVRLVHSPPARSLVVLAYPDIYQACDHVPEILSYKPIGLEGFDDNQIAAMQRKNLLPDDVALLPKGGGWLLIEFGDETRQQADHQARAFADAMKRNGSTPNVRIFDQRSEQLRVWRVRESALGATAQSPGQRDTWPGWEDSAVPPERIGAYLRELRALMNRYGYYGAFYGHFGQGCVHTHIDFDFSTADGIAKFKAFLNRAAEMVMHYGGSLSGEHGDGQARGELLPKMFSPELVQAFREFKAIWDPADKMNPGKLVAPNAIDANLRLGPSYNPAQPDTFFQFPQDEGSLARATVRCVGVGLCRRQEGGTMCPSFMVTREEKHSTRGRARLLFELMQGEIIGRKDWHERSVKDALDLCLACKGCKVDCPVGVDMATYKAEFLSHYYVGRSRPRSAYAFGLIFRWAQFMSRMPGVANFFTQTPFLSDISKWVVGMAPQRRIPEFASQTFRDWFLERGTANEGQPLVILWPDTFNNYFLPDTAKAAVEVLEAAGFQVEIPHAVLCCGRPLYDYGFLDRAKQQLVQVLDALQPQIKAGTPVVGLEPSCVAVFRDELTNLFPDDENAKRLQQQTFTFDEFLDKRARNFAIPKLERRAIVHGHCHHKAIMRMNAQQAVLSRLGLDYRILDSGCCGMAGSFGFERGEHFQVSTLVGERVLLPAVRNAEKDTLIIADGYSCREQIAQTTNRRALHLAQVIQMAMVNK